MGDSVGECVGVDLGCTVGFLCTPVEGDLVGCIDDIREDGDVAGKEGNSVGSVVGLPCRYVGCMDGLSVGLILA